jgi:hypothetical protein
MEQEESSRIKMAGVNILDKKFKILWFKKNYRKS